MAFAFLHRNTYVHMVSWACFGMYWTLDETTKPTISFASSGWLWHYTPWGFGVCMWSACGLCHCWASLQARKPSTGSPNRLAGPPTVTVREMIDCLSRMFAGIEIGIKTSHSMIFAIFWVDECQATIVYQLLWGENPGYSTGFDPFRHHEGTAGHERRPVRHGLWRWGPLWNEGFHGHGGTPKWMVYGWENPTKMDDLSVPLFQETPKSCENLKYVLCIHMMRLKIEDFTCGNFWSWWFSSASRASLFSDNRCFVSVAGHFISCRISWKWHAKWQSRTLMQGLEEILLAENHCASIFNHFQFGPAADLLYSRCNLEIEEVHGFRLGYKHMYLCLYLLFYT